MASTAQVRVDSALSTFATKYENSGFIADEVSPIIMSDKLSGKFFTKNRKDVSTPIDDDSLGSRGEASELSYDVSTSSYSVEDRGLKDIVPSSVVSNADEPLSPEEDSVDNLMQAISLNREIRVATLYQTAGNFPAANKASVSNFWSDSTSGTPLADINTGILALASPGAMVKKYLIMSLKVFHALSTHPDFLSLRAGGGSDRGQVSEDEMAAFLRIDRVFVSEVTKNTAQRGQATATYARVWSDTQATLVAVPENVSSPERRGVSVFGVTFRAPPGLQVRRWDEPKLGRGGSTAIQVELADDEIIAQSDMGYLFSSVLA